MVWHGMAWHDMGTAARQTIKLKILLTTRLVFAPKVVISDGVGCGNVFGWRGGNRMDMEQNMPVFARLLIGRSVGPTLVVFRGLGGGDRIKHTDLSHDGTLQKQLNVISN